MSIERLSGGLTPADGSDPRTFPEIFNGFADEFEGKNIPAFGTAVPSDGDALVYNDAEGVYEPGEGGAGSLEDLTDTDITTPVAGEKLVYDGTEWVNLEGFIFVDTVTFTSSGTFSKGDYPWLRAIRVKCQGGGGGGGGAQATGAGVTSVGGGGGAGAYAESFITDIAGLDASVTVTRGNGGSGVVGASGNSGTGSSFGSLVTAGGAPGAFMRGATTPPHLTAGGEGGSAGVGDIVSEGNGGQGSVSLTNIFNSGGVGGSSVFGGGPRAEIFAENGNDAVGIGAGGGGGANAQNRATAKRGGNGANGIVIVELYA